MGVLDEILRNFLVWTPCKCCDGILIAFEGFVPASCEQGGKY